MPRRPQTDVVLDFRCASRFVPRHITLVVAQHRFGTGIGDLDGLGHEFIPNSCRETREYINNRPAQVILIVTENTFSFSLFFFHHSKKITHTQTHRDLNVCQKRLLLPCTGPASAAQWPSFA